MKFTPTNIVQLLLLFQSLFFAMFLLTQRKGKQLSNRLLAAFLGTLGLHMFFNLGFEIGLFQFIPNPTHSFGYLYGPFLYGYVLSLEYKNLQIKSIYVLHLAPWLLIFILSWLLPNFDPMYSGIAILLSLVLYLSLTYRSLLRYQKVIQYTQSRYGSISLKWARDFLLYIVTIAILDMLHSFISYQSEQWAWVFYMLLISSLLLMVNNLVFRTLKYPELFNGITQEDERITQLSDKRYASSNLESEQLGSYSEKIQTYFQTHKPYLNAELNLQILASEMDLSARLISQVINSRYEQNFSEYVNHYRIQEAIELFEDNTDSKQTVLEVLYAVGFNSKSSFYAAFKQQTGLTPSQFKQNRRQQP